MVVCLSMGREVPAACCGAHDLLWIRGLCRALKAAAFNLMCDHAMVVAWHGVKCPASQVLTVLIVFYTIYLMVLSISKPQRLPYNNNLDFLCVV